MSTQTPIVELFGRAVTATEGRILASLRSYDRNIARINYDYGSAENVTNRLNLLNNPATNQKLKYPLVLLGYGFREDISGNATRDKAQLTVVIAWPGKVDQSEQARQPTYQRILRPLEKELFGRQLPRFFRIRNVAYSRTERRWITNKANETSDVLDIIEISVSLPKPTEYCLETTNKPLKNF